MPQLINTHSWMIILLKWVRFKKVHSRYYIYIEFDCFRCKAEYHNVCEWNKIKYEVLWLHKATLKAWFRVWGEKENKWSMKKWLYQIITRMNYISVGDHLNCRTYNNSDMRGKVSILSWPRKWKEWFLS